MVDAVVELALDDLVAELAQARGRSTPRRSAARRRAWRTIGGGTAVETAIRSCPGSRAAASANDGPLAFDAVVESADVGDRARHDAEGAEPVPAAARAAPARRGRAAA